MKDLFGLDPAVVFLNHGSFGACPKPVMLAYHTWQWKLENQPVVFLGRQALNFLAESRQKLGIYLSASPDNLVYYPNPTTAGNMVARSVPLKPGDVILTSDHEYGALDRTWEFVCQKTGAVYHKVPLGLPPISSEAYVEKFLSNITPRTRVIFLSHITSATALRLPVETILAKTKGSGMITIVDGAHAPGHIPLDLETLGADVYIGACHKWMCAPKGAAFVYASPGAQMWLEPLVVSWGYHPDPGYGTGNRYLDEQEWQGTRDLSAYLTVPAAISFQEEHNWPVVQRDCAALAVETHANIRSLTHLPPIAEDASMLAPQFFAAFLPEHLDAAQVKHKMYDLWKIEVPVYKWQNANIIRVSFQGYNTKADADLLLAALAQILWP